MIDEKRIKRFIEGAKEAFKEVDDPTFIFPMNILSAYELATSIEKLLKAQGPRVMTLEEVQTISVESIYGVVWLESRMYSDPDNGDSDIWFSGWANPVESCETDINLYAFGNEVPVEAKKRWYGITWRCWTFRPTDEQREETKWDDE